MQSSFNFQELESRAAKIGVSLTELSRDAGLSPSTAHRWRCHGTSPSVANAQKIQNALLIRERSMLAHLLRLHDPEILSFERGPAVDQTGQEARSGFAATGKQEKIPGRNASGPYAPPANGGAA